MNGHQIKLDWKHYFLKFCFPFRIAHGTRDGTDSVFVRITLRNFEGFGECTMPPYLEENKNSAEKFLTEFSSRIDEAMRPGDLLAMLKHYSGNHFVRASIEMAVLDILAKMEGMPLWKFLNLSETKTCRTTYTIGISDADELDLKIQQCRKFRMIKLKLNGKDDIEFVRSVVSKINAEICVDVNQGWTDVNTALEESQKLKELGVKFIEQPFAADDFSSIKKFCAHSPLPVYGDESIWTVSDVNKYRGIYSGINVKLMKTGGILNALKLIENARSNGMKILLGCMSESSCGIAAASHISSLCDYCDLDGPLLISNDPFSELSYNDDLICIPQSGGLGVKWRGNF